MTRLSTLHHVRFFTTLVEYYDKMLEDFEKSKDIILDYIKRRQENSNVRAIPVNDNSMIRSYCTPESIEEWSIREPVLIRDYGEDIRNFSYRKDCIEDAVTTSYYVDALTFTNPPIIEIEMVRGLEELMKS